MRGPYRITDVDDTNAWTIPSVLDYRLDTPYRIAMLSAIGADGAFDLHGDNRAPTGFGTAGMRVNLTGASAAALQTAVDNMRSGVRGPTRSSGRRKLWTREVEDSTLPRWTYARATRNPEIVWQPGFLRQIQPNLSFVLEDPKFYDALTAARLAALGLTDVTLASNIVPEAIDPNLTFAQFTIASTPYTFTLTNDGNLHTQRIIFRFVSQAVNGFTNPRIENLTTLQDFQSSRDGSTGNYILSVDCAPGEGAAQLSTDAGVSWAGDTATLTLGSLQGPLMELQPGANSMRYTDGGTPNLKLQVWWLHAFED